MIDAGLCPRGVVGQLVEPDEPVLLAFQVREVAVVRVHDFPS